MLTRRVKNVFEDNNGILSLKQAEKYGLSKESLRKAYKRGDLHKESKGIFLLNKSDSDDLYTTQLRYQKGIFSHETAAMLHALTTYSPFVYHLTFPRGYHLINEEKFNVLSHHVSKSKFDIGVIKMESWHGNPIYVTDMERTIIDMIRTKNKMPGILDEIIENYIWSENKDIEKLENYALSFGVTKDIEKKVLDHVK